MVKGEDVKLRKKNKALRKKLAKDPSSVSARVAGLIAAKKRRHAGKRRNCQGMCFSLPTPEDPFNERCGKEDNSVSKRKRVLPRLNHNKASRLKGLELDNPEKISAGNSKTEKYMKIGIDVKDGFRCTLRNFGCPSKFLYSCLDSMRDFLVNNGMLNLEEKMILFFDPWGVEFWKAYSSGIDMLENSGMSPSLQQLAWIASTAADSMTHKENDGISFTSPFLLYLVPSQKKANKVRTVFRPLKACGVHTVSVHPGTDVDHQVEGLKICEPEFIIATPERLKEIVLRKAVDISGVSLLVVDGMDTLSHCLDAVQWIKNSINKDCCTLAFRGGYSDGSYFKTAESILRESFHVLSLDDPRNCPGI